MKRLREWILRKLLTADEYGWFQVDRSLRRHGKDTRKPGQISYEFERAFCCSAGLVVQCDFCGTLYFGTDGDYDSGERERYEEKQRAEPKIYIDVEGFTSRVEVDGKTFAGECACGAALPYETFVWNHRFSIASYINDRSQREASESSRDQDLLRIIDE